MKRCDRLVRYVCDYPGQTAWQISTGVSGHYATVASRLHALWLQGRVLRRPAFVEESRGFRYYVSYLVHAELSPTDQYARCRARVQPTQEDVSC